jgi:hypothetical protein
MWDPLRSRWLGPSVCGSMAVMTAVARRAVTLGLTSRRHVDYGRVRSAICPAH